MVEKNNQNGIIIKGIGGFYYVETAIGIFECKARGVFRKEKITPMVGDNVVITINDNAENTIDEIFERRSALQRPPVANIDQLIIVVSGTEPKPNTLLVDRLTAIAVKNNIEPVIVLNKIDLIEVQELIDIYSKTNFKLIAACGKTGEGVDELRATLEGKISAFTGNSGVGKSTLLNLINPELNLATNEISQKLGRGKHTTRECTLIKLNENTYVADTPGFASLEILQQEVILKEDLQYCFPEFEEFLENCKFYPGCAHVKDKGCAVIEAVEQGIISKSRHDSYKALYEEVKDVKEWQIK
ncbi:MAG: ribosome small subunit-dependent GTPase A [Oscillospiraceae bacterium]|nr:ribosome small subunit-dependent GTPase A [Candidatus Limimonas coprohippi]